MTPDQTAVLANELKTDPLKLGYSDHLHDDPGQANGYAIVDLINARNQFAVGMLSASTAFAWAATGPYAKIIDASKDLENPCRASCLVVRDLLLSGSDIHLEDADVQALFNARVETKVISQEEHDDLMNLSKIPASRAQALGLPIVGYKDVCDVFWNDDGSAK